MKKKLLPQNLVIVSLAYWVLLTYMIAALLFWFIELEKQNQTISTIRLHETSKTDPRYPLFSAGIEEARKRKTAQYIGEGATFLALILLGAVFVYRATRRQIRLAQQQQNFMMAVTHELKTPIAITQLNLETLQKRKLDEEKQQKLIHNTLQEANRLNTLCSNILLASQLDSGIYRSDKEELNFTDLVQGCIDDFKNRFPQKTVIEQVEEGIYLNGEPLLLQMLVNNLVDNARKYSPRESPITLSLAQVNHIIVLQVSDEGVGVPVEEKKKIFQKFYRGGDENTRKSQGTGLGLYLCRKIAESHKANISVTDRIPSGSSFVVRFELS